MQKTLFQNRHLLDMLISFIVLGVLLLFTFVFLFIAPYPGFYFNPFDGKVLVIYENGNPAAGLREGDSIERIGSITMDAYRSDKNLNLFEKAQPGQTIDIVIRRDGESLTIPWVYPGFNSTEFLARFFNIWWLAYIFWFFGMSTQLFIRPKDARWSLLVTGNYLIAIFIILGNFSIWQIWRGPVLLRVVTWLILPVYIQFHWIFPTTIRNIPRWVWNAFYAFSLGIALAEFFLPVPRFLYFFALVIALGGGIFLLALHYFLQRDQRREVSLLLLAALLALLPVISISLIGSNGKMPQSGPLSLVALPILPGAYFYILFRRRLGGLELRANRVISIYVFLVLLGTALLFVVGYSGLMDNPGEATVFAAVPIALLTTFLSILIFPTFQALIERRVLGITLPHQNLQETYSERITTSTSLSSLIQLLSDEVFPSLLVRQFVFFRVSGNQLSKLLARDVPDGQMPGDENIVDLVSLSGKHLPASEDEDRRPSWIRLILPLKIGEDLIGLWLLGRRDPDDIYPQTEIPILQSLANQTAIALSNILQTERLRGLYRENINRYEEERLRLALELHDGVLNQMAVLSLSLDPSSTPVKFKEAYDRLAQQLRGIVSDLRPPMLQYGLEAAFEELADNLMERSKDSVTVTIDIRVKEDRYPQDIEVHLFRIVQEASENAVRHGHAQLITISGQLDSGMIQLGIVDDGIGFAAGENLDLNSLLVEKHFGLAGIIERANLIGAELKIDSAPNIGTQIRVSLDLRQHGVGD